MFQTVGLSLLPKIAQSLRLPLFTRVIQGSPVTVAGEYGSRRGVLDRDDDGSAGGGTEGDETEDLYELLKEVKVRANAIYLLRARASPAPCADSCALLPPPGSGCAP